MPHKTRRATKTQIRQRPRRNAGRAISASRRPSTAIVVRSPGPKPWLIQPEELTILKNAVCKGATDAELQFCLAVARRRKLDPFKGQIWFVPRRDRGADDGEGGAGAKVWIPVVSIGGLCHVGARDHKDYGSFSEPEYGPMITVEWRWKGNGPPKKLQVPEWARIEAWKKGATQPTVGKVWWTEIYPNIDYAPMVRQMPKRMLAKCAQAQAIRLAYPETGGLYIQEEIQEVGPPQFTPGGRAIISTQEPSPEPSPEDMAKYEEAVAKAQATPTSELPFKKLVQYYMEHPGIDPRVVELSAAVTPKLNKEWNKAQTKKVTTPIDVKPSEAKVLTYVWFDASQSARIDEPKFKVLADFKAVLLKLVKNGNVAPNGEELEALKFECSKRGIELKRRQRDAGE
jgi:hypothetical protein